MSDSRSGEYRRRFPFRNWLVFPPILLYYFRLETDETDRLGCCKWLIDPGFGAFLSKID
jgi:hypothetical protein